MNDQHASVLYFGATDQATFPLILVIGREPNTLPGSNQQMGTHIGPYDFRSSPLCSFWNTSYGMVAREVNLATWQLKQECIRRNGSPLVYADALPHCMANAVKNKWPNRGMVAHQDQGQHMARTLSSHTQLIDRVELVIMAGIEHQMFTHARTSIQSAFTTKGTPVIDLPFFFGSNSVKIQQALPQPIRTVIQSIYHRF